MINFCTIKYFVIYVIIFTHDKTYIYFLYYDKIGVICVITFVSKKICLGFLSLGTKLLDLFAKYCLLLLVDFAQD